MQPMPQAGSWAGPRRTCGGDRSDRQGLRALTNVAEAQREVRAGEGRALAQQQPISLSCAARVHAAAV